jgi:5-methylcytosine-specific restriction protein B
METEKRIFSRIVKNDYGRGGAWDFYWGAFYPKDGKRIESAQLFLWMDEDYLDFGFYIGEYGSEQRSRFTKNCSLHLEILENVLREPLSRDDLVFGETAATGDYRSKPVPGLKGNEWLNQIEQARIRAGVRLSRNEVQVMSDDTLAKNIADVFHDLFPLVLLATKDDPLTEIRRYVGEIPIDDETLNPEYSLEQCAAETHFDLEVLQRWVRAVERKKQAIFYGPPGTGKTFVAERLALHMIGEGDGFTEIVQFHPSYAYEDFMQGLRPRALSGGGLEYVMTPGRFKDFCDRARECKGPCVLIIDEINRANLSRVLGELMFLLEYRDQSVPLSGGERFQIPQNVRIIGTMNTADRSIALVDHALRRRFAFLELRPDYEVLRRYHADTGFDPEGLINLLQRLNAAIDDRHYSVGISFFLSPSIEEDVADIWQMELEPYIEELFFDQPDKAAGFEWDKVKAEIVG